jgi:hypothetical protein
VRIGKALGVFLLTALHFLTLYGVADALAEGVASTLRSFSALIRSASRLRFFFPGSRRVRSFINGCFCRVSYC